MGKRRREIFGREVERQDLGDFVLVESLYPPAATMPRHTHETAHVSVVLEGNFTEKSGRRERSSETASLIVH
ncbi:MAG TPA: hypothetical protein VJS44_12910, partial [Pyrinomonadaceae bacterium]|nr:hypothetical protein [Pyrinomonadaceae bacterium]